MPEAVGEVLVIGGTGMLRPAVHELVDRGRRVVVASRRPEQAARPETGRGRFVPVVVDWQEPETLVDSIVTATGGRSVTHVVVWVHSPYRTAVMRELDRVVASDAIVVQVWGSAGEDPRNVLATELVTLPDRRMRDVILGYVREARVSRWLTHTEISDGVLHALDRAEALEVVGQIDLWDQRP